jgi:cytochrome c oxidase cbb3-type subunit 3
MSDEHSNSDSGQDQVVHEYDDIQEYDNALPLWWLVTFFGTAIFAIGYFFVYQTFKAADLPNAAFEKEVAVQRAADAERIKALGNITDDSMLLLSKDATTVAKGKEIFTTNCAVCHRADGGGGIGPNLTDKAWLHGGKPAQIFKTVNEGVPTKPMAAWGPQLGTDKVQSVAAYVLTLKDSNVAGGKAPQGVEEP